MRSVSPRSVLLRFAVLCGVTAGSVVALPAVADAAVDPATTTFVTMHSPAGPWWYAEATHLWRSDVDQVTLDHAPGPEYGYLRMHMTHGGGDWATSITLSPPEGHFEVGSYGTDCAAECTTAGIGIHDGDNSNVCDDHGTFQVHAVSADLSTLWLTYQVSCGTDQPYFGEIRRNHPGGGAALVLGELTSWPAQYVGLPAGPAPVTIFNTGDSPLPITSATVSAGASDFVLAANTCTVIPAGGSCSLTVRHTPTAEGPRTGALTFRAGDTDRVVSLAGHGDLGHSGWAYWTQANHAYWGGNSFASDPTTSVVDVSGNPGYLQIRFASRGEQRGPSGFTLGYACADAIRAGSGTCNHLETNDIPGTDISQVTVHESVVVDEKVTRLSLTYQHRKSGYDGWQYGSIAWHASDPIQPLPGIVGVNPDPVTGLSASGDYDAVRLTWTAPVAPDWTGVEVWFAIGKTAPSKRGEGYLGYRGNKSAVRIPGLHPNNAYAFSVFTKDSEGRWSTRKSVALGATKLTLKTSHSSLVYGGTATLEGRLTPNGGHRYVDIMARVPGSDTWYTVETVSTASDGSFHAYVDPARTYDYWAYYEGSGSEMGASVGPLRVTVKKDVVAWTDKTTARLGSTFKISAGVNPVAKGKTITLQRYRDGKWRDVTSVKTLGVKANVFSVKPTSRGTHSYRVIAGSGSGLSAGKSVTMKLKVT